MARKDKTGWRVFAPRLWVPAIVIIVPLLGFGTSILAHEHTYTHTNLTRAAFRLLNSPFFKVEEGSARFGGLSEQQIENELAQGVIDEDECKTDDHTDGGRDWGLLPYWNSHFYEAKRGVRLGIAKAAAPGCNTDENFTTAADRANTLYALAISDFNDSKFQSAFRILGRVMHLLQDMTSPPHVHDDPHAEIPLFSHCEGDADDFERWGYCEGLVDEESPSTHICDYFDGKETDSGSCRVLVPQEECVVDFDSDGVDESYGVPPSGFKCRLWAALKILYNGASQGNRKSSDPIVPTSDERSMAEAFIRHVANITYDFTTFRVHLKDETIFVDRQGSSELRAMLRGSTVADCNNLNFNDKGLCELEKLGKTLSQWHIRGRFQNIGKTFGRPGRVEKVWPDSREEWWLMPTDYQISMRARFIGGFDQFISGYAYVENSGGEGPFGFGDTDNFIPWRYGCTFENRSLCGDGSRRTSKSKLLYQRLYGTTDNNEDPVEPIGHSGKTLLRIYGDVLYPTAVAYGAGLIQAFIDDVVQPPIADAGGPYGAPACTLINFNADSSRAVKGKLVSYEWDFTDDGTFDVKTTKVVHPYAYPAPFFDRARLRVTDEDGATDEDTTAIEVWEDTTPPVITKLKATPPRLEVLDGKLKKVTITPFVDDPCGPAACKIVRVSSPDSSASSRDWEVIDDLVVKLRAEAPAGEKPKHRRYDVHVECSDAAGNASAGVVAVRTGERTPGGKQ